MPELLGLLAALDEPLEFFSRDEPACLAIDLEPFQCARSEIAADCLNAQMQLTRDLLNGHESFGAHRRHVTKDSTLDVACSDVLRRIC